MRKSTLVKGAGNLFGTVLEYNLILTGIVIGGIAVLAGKKDMGKNIQRVGKGIGRFAGKATRTSVKIAGTLIDAASSEGVVLGKAIGNRVVKSQVKIYGDAREFYKDKKIVEAEYNQTK